MTRKNCERQPTARAWTGLPMKAIFRCLLSIAMSMAILFIPLLANAADKGSLQFQKAVEIPALTQQELVAVALDADVFEVASDVFSDLRLYDQKQRLVPFILHTAAETRVRTTRKHWDVKPISARPVEENSLEVIIRLGENDPAPQGVRLVSPLSDFQHRVRVFASDDGEEWQPLVEDEVIFDYSRFIDVRNDSIAFPRTPLKHLRILIDDVTDEQQSRLMELTRELVGDEELARAERTKIERRPFRVEKIQLWHEVHHQQIAEGKRATYAVAAMRLEPDPPAGTTVVIIDTHREPLTQFTLVTPTRNFSRRVRVEVPQVQGIRTVWRTIATDTLSQLEFKDLQRADLSIEFPESRYPQYRLTIEDRDSPPLEITRFSAEGTVRELVFFALPGQNITLAYGNEEMEAAKFDTSAITAALRQGYQPQAAGLSPAEQAQTLLDAGGGDWRDLWNHRGILFGTIAIMVAILGWFLYQAGRRLDSLPESRG